MIRRVTFLALICFVALPGCVKRTISITSEPPGALVWLNDREVGRTPVDVGFTYYGEYDVRLDKDGYEPLMTTGKAKPPWWDHAGPDLLAELSPGKHHSRVEWHYDLEPVETDTTALIDRADELRAATIANDDEN